MKRIFSIALLAFALLSCSKADPYVKEDDEALAGPRVHLDIAVLGNSYSNDAYCYLPYILRQYGITCNIHIYYRGSGSLHDLYEQWYDTDKYGLADLDNGHHVRAHFSIDTRYGSRWKQEEIASADEIVKLKEWDIISLQQGGKRAKDIDSYYPYLDQIIGKIGELCPNDPSIAWFMAYNAGNDDMNVESLEAQRQIVESHGFDLVFPVATAVFNCQNNEAFAGLGDSKYRKMYASDNVHLQEGVPCYIAALAIAESILRAYKPGFTVIGNRVRPTEAWLSKIRQITPNGESIGVDETNCALAQKAAVLANDNMFEIGKIE